MGTVEAVVEMVDNLVAEGVDLIKAYEMLSPEQFKAVLDRAKEHDLPVTGHIPLSMLVSDAPNAGLRSMEHLRNLDMACSSDADLLLEQSRKMLEEGANDLGGILRSRIHRAQRGHAIATFDENLSKKVLQTLADNGTWQIPTLALTTGRLTELSSNEEWKKTFRFLPEPSRTQWNEQATEYSQQPPDSISLVVGKWSLEMVKRLDDAGVGFMAGTDTPIGFLTPGFSLHRELEMLVRGGLSPLQVIKAQSSQSSERIGGFKLIADFKISQRERLI